jgi:hypothetical protein
LTEKNVETVFTLLKRSTWKHRPDRSEHLRPR